MSNIATALRECTQTLISFRWLGRQMDSGCKASPFHGSIMPECRPPYSLPVFPKADGGVSLLRGSWANDHSFNELRLGKEKEGGDWSTSLTISIRLHFLLKANSRVLAWRWIAALELRFNQ